MTLRSNRREEGFTNAALEIGYQGVRVGDLVIHSMDGFAGAIGVSESSGKSSPVVHVYTAATEVDARFFASQLRMLALSGFIAALAKGIRERSTSFDAETFRSLVLPFPRFDEQRAIADFLDVETSRIDAIVATRDAQMRLLDELERAHIDAGFAELMAPATRLGRLVAVQTGVTVDAARAASQDDVEAPYLRVANVQPGRLDLDTVTSIRVPRALAERSTLRAGDVLMTEGGDIDKLGRGTVWNDEIPGCLHQNHVFAVRPTRDLNPGYLAVFTRTSSARAHFESTGVQSTNLASTSASKVRDLQIPLATPAEQAQLVTRLEARLSQIDAARRATERSIELLRERKQALITAAVTGQLDLAREIAEEAS